MFLEDYENLIEMRKENTIRRKSLEERLSGGFEK